VRKEFISTFEEIQDREDKVKRSQNVTRTAQDKRWRNTKTAEDKGSRNTTSLREDSSFSNDAMQEMLNAAMDGEVRVFASPFSIYSYTRVCMYLYLLIYSSFHTWRIDMLATGGFLCDVLNQRL
jgi:hypothetical protein